MLQQDKQLRSHHQNKRQTDRLWGANDQTVDNKRSIPKNQGAAEINDSALSFGAASPQVAPPLPFQDMSDIQEALEQVAFIVKTNAQGIITEVNVKFCEFLQYSREELLGKDRAFIKVDSRPKKFFHSLQVAVASHKVWQGEVQVKAKNGSHYWVETIVVPCLDSSGEPRHYIAIGFDITDRKATVATLAEANRMKDEFLGVVSHELRSPLSAILGWAQLAKSRQLDKTLLTRALDTIERNARLQSQLIDDLLDLSRLIRGKLRLKMGPVDLISLVEVVLDTARPAAVAKAIQIDFCFSRSAICVWGDTERLQQAIWKLLSNAIKFTRQRGRVAIHLSAEPDRAVLRIRDTGCGIAPERLPYIFDYHSAMNAFTSQEPTKLELGLAIAYQLVELHGGALIATSPGIDRGSTFTVLLPLWKQGDGGDRADRGNGDRRGKERIPIPLEATSGTDLAPSSETSSPLEREVSPSFKVHPSLKGVQVLVVDDNADAREFLLATLGACGAEVTAAASVHEALAELEQSKPDVLVSDIAMPGQNGYDLIRQVRAKERVTEPLPAVALTAFARKEDRASALAAGFQKYLSKPVEPAELVSTLAELVPCLPTQKHKSQCLGERDESLTVLQAPSYLPENGKALKTEDCPAIANGWTVHSHAPLILIVEDNLTVLNYLQSLLSCYYRVAVARDGAEALEQAVRLRPDLILSDLIMPRKSGLELLREIRLDPELRLTPIIFLTGRMESQARIESFDAGADDYISKPFDEAELLARVRNLLRVRATELQLAGLNRQLEEQKRQLEMANQALQHRALFDSLTEVANRHHFNEYLETEWRRLAREQAPLSLIMADIDYFKLYNDTYGHQAGDECLRQVAGALRRAVKRSADLVARYGGEEFVIVLPNTDAEGATCVAQTVRSEVKALQIPHGKSLVNEFVTVSLGVACWVPAPKSSPSHLISVADEALYRAKAEGRDRVATNSCHG